MRSLPNPATDLDIMMPSQHPLDLVFCPSANEHDGMRHESPRSGSLSKTAAESNVMQIVRVRVHVRPL
jgi:hypothetical protein